MRILSRWICPNYAQPWNQRSKLIPGSTCLKKAGLHVQQVGQGFSSFDNPGSLWEVTLRDSGSLQCNQYTSQHPYLIAQHNNIYIYTCIYIQIKHFKSSWAAAPHRVSSCLTGGPQLLCAGWEAENSKRKWSEPWYAVPKSSLRWMDISVDGSCDRFKFDGGYIWIGIIITIYIIYTPTI